MKKVVVILLAICMLTAILTGCNTGNNVPMQEDKSQNETQVSTGEKKNETEQADKEVAVGTILDKPEVLFDSDIEGMSVSFTYPGGFAGETASMEIAIKQVTEDTYQIYVTDGLLKNEEIVYEVTDAGVTKYYKDAFMTAFEQETELSQQQLEKEKNETLILLSYFMMQHPDYANFQYRKSDKVAAELTGDVYVYDLMKNNEYAGQVCIDKTTGLMVSLKDEQGESSFTVLKFKVADVEIPAYK